MLGMVPTAVDAASSDDRRRINLALAALAAAAFVYVTAETFPIALLPQLSAGLGVSAGAVGLLVTVYAGVAGVSDIGGSDACLIECDVDRAGDGLNVEIDGADHSLARAIGKDAREFAAGEKGGHH